MTRHAFLLHGDRIYHIANPCGAGLNYQARAQTLAPGEYFGPHRQDAAETTVVVTGGQLEVMVNGIATIVTASHFVRIPAGLWYGLRNGDRHLARLLVRVSHAPETPRPRRIMVDIAAA